MRADELQQILDGLNGQMENQQKIVDEVAALKTSHKWQKIMLIIAMVMIVVMGVFGALAVNALFNAQRAISAVEEFVVLQERDRQAVAETACKIRNGGNLEIRNTFETAFGTLEDLTGPSEQLTALRDSIPNPEDTDRDCNGDAVLTSADYPD